MDGTPTLRMNEFMLASLAHGKVNLGPPRTPDTGASLAPPTELTFVLDAATKTNIAAAEEHFDTLIGQHDMEVLHYEGYGKDYIKAHKASPDAWVQMVKQLAFHKMFGRPGVCYESAQTRKFQLGRTEVIRSASNESKAWAEAMLDPKQTVSVARAVEVLPLTLFIPRTSTVLHCSAKRSRDTSSTLRGLQTARALTVTCSVSRSCSRRVNPSPKSTRTRRLERRTTGSSRRLSCPLPTSTAGDTAKVRKLRLSVVY